MRKVLTSLLLLLFVAQVSAQTPAANAIKDLDKAKAETQNPKKASNPASWVKLANAYTECFAAPLGGVWQGMGQVEAKMLLKDQAIQSSTQEEINGSVLSADTYADKVLYYDQAGKLVAWTIKEPVLKDECALNEAFNAFKKANELDVKGAQNKVITESLKNLQGRYINEAMSFYTLGKNKEASDNFEASLAVSSHPLLGLVDSTITYYTAVTAAMAGDNAKAIRYFEECVKLGFDQNGDVQASLSNCYKASGDTVKATEILSEAFTKYPQSQSILVGLINIYMESNEEPSKLIDLLRVAQNNEPNNPSLFYAEGNVYVKLGDFAKAIEAYKKSSEIDPNYFWGPFSEGKTYYDWAVDIQEKANMESDDNKYMELLGQLDQSLENSIVPLEKAFELASAQGETELQNYVAELLKNVYFRFREKGESFQAGYEKYNSFLGK